MVFSSYSIHLLRYYIQAHTKLLITINHIHLYKIVDNYTVINWHNLKTTVLSTRESVRTY